MLPLIRARHQPTWFWEGEALYRGGLNRAFTVYEKKLNIIMRGIHLPLSCSDDEKILDH